VNAKVISAPHIIVNLNLFHLMDIRANPKTMKAIPITRRDHADMTDSFSYTLSKRIRINHPSKSKNGAIQ
jgi:hypothetical protein